MIRYDTKLNKRIRSLVNRYNAKIIRLEKKIYLYDAIKIPKKLKVKDIKNMYKDRSELNRYLKSREYFLTRGSEYIRENNISNYEDYVYKIYKRLANRRLLKEKRYLEGTKVKIGGRSQIVSFAEMADVKYLNVISKLKYANKSINEINDVLEYTRKLEKNVKLMDKRKWQDNFITMIRDICYMQGLSFSETKKITDNLYKLSPEAFEKFYNEEKSLELVTVAYQMIMDFGINEAVENPPSGTSDVLYDLSENIEKYIEPYL